MTADNGKPEQTPREMIARLADMTDEDGTMQAELSIIVHHDFFKFIFVPGFAIWLWMCVIAGRAGT